MKTARKKSVVGILPNQKQSAPVELLKVDVRGHMVSVTVNRDGMFEAAYKSKRKIADTLEKLRESLIRSSRMQKIVFELPFLYLEDCPDETGNYYMKRGVAYGVNLKNNDVMVRWQDGERGTISSFHNSMGRVFYTPSAKARDLDKLVSAYSLYRKAKSAYEEIHEKCAMRVYREAHNAHNAAFEALVEKEEGEKEKK